MATFSLGKHPHVELCDLLKLEGWSESGAQAKIAIGEGLVKVDGAGEDRHRRRAGKSRRLGGNPQALQNCRGSDRELCRTERDRDGLSCLMAGGAALTGPTYCLRL